MAHADTNYLAAVEKEAAVRFIRMTVIWNIRKCCRGDLHGTAVSAGILEVIEKGRG